MKSKISFFNFGLLRKNAVRLVLFGLDISSAGQLRCLSL